MLFFDITEYSYPTTSNRQTTNEMATTMTPAQFDWRQFSTEHIQRETGNDDAATTTMTYNKLDHSNIGDYDDQEEPAFNKASANRTTTSNAERRHQQRHSPLRSIKPPAIPAIDTDADVKEAHECVQKPKTRAERRAIDAPLTETDVLPETTKAATKRERRSDYWVQRDDERRNAARTSKTQSQVLSEDEEEELPW